MQAGIALHRAGRLAEAEAAYRRALADSPDDGRALHLLGLLKQDSSSADEALALLRRSVQVAPQVAEFRNNLAGLLGSLGYHDEAVAILREALAIRPDYPQALDNLGVALENLERYHDAIRALVEAIRLAPNLGPAHTHLSNCLRKCGRASEALVAAGRGVELGDQSATAYNVRGAALLELNRLDEAIDDFSAALSYQPGLTEARVNLATALLTLGDLRRGFREYEARLSQAHHRRELPARRWDGSDLRGKTILLYSDGGIGNTIHWARYVALVTGRGGRVVLECHEALAALAASIAGVAEVVCPGDVLPAIDLYAAVSSVPHLFGTELHSIPAEVPYFRPAAALVSHWQPYVERLAGIKVGLCWQGSQSVVSMQDRSIPVGALAPLGQIPGVSLISLQQGAPPPGDLHIQALPGLDHVSMQLVDVAAVMGHLDLVISCDTSIAHLAGALGVPVWVALKHHPCWRWMLDRDDSPWYPTMRLFRQPRPGDWRSVIASMTHELTELARHAPTTGRSTHAFTGFSQATIDAPA
jgi:tetratricopeptide (TPR) repeat protein